MNPLRSIRWRLQIWYGLLLALVTAGLLIFFFQYAKNARVVQVDAQLTNDFLRILPQHLPPEGFGGRGPKGRPGPEGRFDPGGRPEEMPGPPDGRPGGPSAAFEATGKYLVVYESDGRTRYRTPQAPETEQPKPRASGTWTESRWNGANRELVHVSPQGQAIVVGVPSGLLQSEMNVLTIKMLALGGGLFVFALVVGAWITGAALRPIQKIAETARQIAAGDWRKRIPTEGSAEELAGLSEVLNDSFDRIERSFQNQARFTADASHELGNPVSIVLSQTQLALDRPREAPEYVKALEACRRAGERMRDLTRDLLDLAGYESGVSARQRRECDLREVVDEALAAVDDLVQECKATVVKEVAPVVAEVHARAISQALINLLNNALKHNEEGVRITVRLRQEGSWARLEVADSGQGVPQQAQAHIFERFHRGDPAQRATGRGLGLAIARAIMEMHRGSIALESSPSSGSRFVLKIPLRIDQSREE